jgi:hypothetical protein
MIAVPVGLIWPQWITAHFTHLWDAWAAHLNPRYYMSTAELSELRRRLDECRDFLNSVGL